MTFLKRLPEKILRTAYFAVDEAAWPKEDALRVVDICAQDGLVLISIEVWLPTVPGPTIPMPFFYHWKMEPKTDSVSWNAYVEEARRRAKKFIQSFDWDKSDWCHQQKVPFFNLCFLESGIST